MNYTHIIREIGRGSAGARDMSREEAQLLYGAMLDGGVPDLELGAIAIALRMKGESNEEMVGFLSAARERLHSLRRPQGRIRPVVIPSYNGARKSANLTPLLALLLQRFGVPVLVHGPIEGYGRVTSAQIFREFSLGSLLPCTSHAQAQQAMDEHGLAYVPLSVLSPGLNDQLALRARLGLRNSAHSLVKMLDPFKSEGLMLAAATHPDYIDTMRDVLSAVGTRALLLRGTEGEPVADARRMPQMDGFLTGAQARLEDAQGGPLTALPELPFGADAKTTATLTRAMLKGLLPVPDPIARQVTHTVRWAEKMAADAGPATSAAIPAP